MAAENRFVVFVLISFNGIEGILKVMRLHKNAAKKWLRFLTIIINQQFVSQFKTYELYSYELIQEI